jgi:nucleotide-binding universal stress UspA family protein
MTPKKILFCTDFSENSANAREAAKEYAKAFNGEVIILHVINVSQLGYPAFQQGVPFDQQEIIKTVEDSVIKALEEVAQDFGKTISSVETAYLMGNPPSEIVGYAKEKDMELVVIGTHGWTGLKHLVLGSVAENVVRSCSCPVLTVRSPDTQ